MNWLLAALLGAIQGITEFLPISSTGHILFFEKLFSFTPCSGQTFEAVVQLGSGFALFFYYWRKLVQHTIKQNALIILATIPAAVIGLLFHTTLKTHLASTVIMATTLILGGIFFLYVEHLYPTFCSISEKIRFKQAGTVGAAQALALIPGVSRSGITISTGLYLGLDRSTAVDFSFLLALPILFGSGFYELFSHFSTLTSNEWTNLTIGFFSSFFVSLIIIKPLLYTITRFGLTPFGWYRIIFGLLLLGWTL